MQTVHVRVNDSATGKPTPCRVRFTDAGGNHFLPFGCELFFATGANQDVGGKVLLGMKPHAYIDGACEIALPPGPLQVHLAKGPEFRSRTVDVNLAPGKMALRLEIERWIDLRTQGWYSGDTRVHFLSPHAALLEAQAEDVAVVNLLATACRIENSFHQSFQAVPNLLAFSGQNPCLEVPGHMVVVNTHNGHPQLGSLALLHCHRVVYPLTFGGPEGKENWSLAAWCDQCHRKQGLVVWTRTSHEAEAFVHGEPLADLVLGKIDAFEIDFFEDSPFDVLPIWYTLANAGLVVPLAGASGKDCNGVSLGAMRTYAKLKVGEPLTYRAWIEALRAGRTFITNGPLLTLTVNGQPPGSTLQLDGERVRVQAEARSRLAFRELEIVANGKVVATAAGVGDPCTATIDIDLPVASGWLAARCRGEQQILQRPANQRLFAHTSAVRVQRQGQPAHVDPSALGVLRKDLEAMLRGAPSEQLAGVFRTALARLADRPGG